MAFGTLLITDSPWSEGFEIEDAELRLTIKPTRCFEGQDGNSSTRTPIPDENIEWVHHWNLLSLMSCPEEDEDDDHQDQDDDEMEETDNETASSCGDEAGSEGGAVGNESSENGEENCARLKNSVKGSTGKGEAEERTETNEAEEESQGKDESEEGEDHAEADEEDEEDGMMALTDPAEIAEAWTSKDVWMSCGGEPVVQFQGKFTPSIRFDCKDGDTRFELNVEQNEELAEMNWMYTLGAQAVKDISITIKSVNAEKGYVTADVKGKVHFGEGVDVEYPFSLNYERLPLSASIEVPSHDANGDSDESEETLEKRARDVIRRLYPHGLDALLHPSDVDYSSDGSTGLIVLGCSAVPAGAEDSEEEDDMNKEAMDDVNDTSPAKRKHEAEGEEIDAKRPRED